MNIDQLNNLEVSN